KTYYSHAIESFGEYNVSGPSNKRRFVRAYLKASGKAFSIENVKSGFQNTGIWPLNGGKVVEEVKRTERPRTPPPKVIAEPAILLNTPYNRVNLVHMVQDLQGTPSSVTHSRRQKARKVVKYTDSILVQSAHATAEKHRLMAKNE